MRNRDHKTLEKAFSIGRQLAFENAASNGQIAIENDMKVNE